MSELFLGTLWAHPCLSVCRIFQLSTHWGTRCPWASWRVKLFQGACIPRIPPPVIFTTVYPQWGSFSQAFAPLGFSLFEALPRRLASCSLVPLPFPLPFTPWASAPSLLCGTGVPLECQGEEYGCSLPTPNAAYLLMSLSTPPSNLATIASPGQYFPQRGLLGLSSTWLPLKFLLSAFHPSFQNPWLCPCLVWPPNADSPGVCHPGLPPSCLLPGA